MKKEVKKGESWRKGYRQGRKEALEECLGIINHSIGKDDAYGEICEKLKNK